MQIPFLPAPEISPEVQAVLDAALTGFREAQDAILQAFYNGNFARITYGPDGPCVEEITRDRFYFDPERDSAQS